MAIALLLSAIVICALVPRYARACAENILIANAHRDKMYAAAFTLVNAADDVVPSHIVDRVRNVVITSRSKFFLPRVTLFFLFRKAFGGPKRNGASLSKDLESLSPQMRDQLHTVVREALGALAHNDVIFGAVLRWVIKRTRKETREEAVLEFERQACAA